MPVVYLHLGADPNDGDWVCVQREGGGKRGVLPLSYVNIEAEGASEGHAALVEMLTADEAQQCVSRTHLFSLFRSLPLLLRRARSLSTIAHTGRLLSLLPLFSLRHTPRRYCVALFDFAGQDAAELAITEGEKLRYCGVDPVDAAWAKVERLGTGDAGVVPGAYVEIAADGALIAAAVQSGAAVLDAQEKGVVMFDWSDPDAVPEFSLSEGDAVTVVAAEGEPEFWSATSAAGITGFIPKTYVDLS